MIMGVYERFKKPDTFPGSVLLQTFFDQIMKPPGHRIFLEIQAQISRVWLFDDIAMLENRFFYNPKLIQP